MVYMLQNCNHRYFSQYNIINFFVDFEPIYLINMDDVSFFMVFSEFIYIYIYFYLYITSFSQ